MPETIDQLPDLPDEGKRGRGQPTLYREEYCDEVIKCGSLGYSKAMMAAHINVCVDTLDNWMEAHPNFFQSMKRARGLSLSWWERKAQENVGSKDFNAQLWKHCMHGRFAQEYRDNLRVEHTGKDGGPIATESHVTARPQMTREEWIKTYVEGDGLKRDAPAGNNDDA